MVIIVGSCVVGGGLPSMTTLDVSCNDFFHKITFQSKCNCVTLLSYHVCVTEKSR